MSIQKAAIIARESGIFYISQLLVLLAIGDEKSPVKPFQLARALDLHGSTVSIACDQLSTLGLVRRVRDDEDRRLVFLSLTEKGKSVEKKIREAA